MSWLLDHAPIFGLLFFFGIFVGVAFATYRPSAKQRLQTHALIPLTEDAPHD